jgi:RNA polymerase sigma-70 factor, ECF subfamily
VTGRIRALSDTHLSTDPVNSPMAAAKAPIEAPPVEPVPIDFDVAYARYFPFVWRCLQSLGVPAVAVDDAAQDVFVVVHRRLPDFRHASNLRTWLYGIVRNVAANHRRSAGRKAPTQSLDARWPSDTPGPHERVQDAEAAAFVQHFLETLEPTRRDVFVLVVLEELGVPEVAEVLGIGVNTAYTRLRLARSEFREALARRGERR